MSTGPGRSRGSGLVGTVLGVRDQDLTRGEIRDLEREVTGNGCPVAVDDDARRKPIKGRNDDFY